MTVRTRADLLANSFQDGQANNSISAEDLRDLVDSVNSIGATAAAEIHSEVTQTAALADTPYNVALEINGFIEQITHSTTVDNNEITLTAAGVYELIVNVTISQTSGQGAQVAVWIEEAAAATPTTWVSTGTALRRDGSGNLALGFASLMHMDRHIIGDKYRVVWQSSTDTGQLTAVPSANGVPLIPSVDLHIKKIGD